MHDMCSIQCKFRETMKGIHAVISLKKCTIMCVVNNKLYLYCNNQILNETYLNFMLAITQH